VRQKSIEILDQLGSLANRLPPEIYSRPLSCLQENSIGRHVRHIVEFFECLPEATENGEVNYDLRRRDLLIETDPDCALQRIGRIQLALIRIGMQQHFPEIALEEDLGVAFSTLRYLQQKPA
jgi:hypothetical protein